MQILLRSARIVDPQSPFDGQVTDLLLDNGLIRQIGDNLTASENTRVIEHENLHVSPGWVDLRVAGKDPGFEHKEDLSSVCAVAAAGGFTDIALLPNTQPAVDNKSTLGYIRRMTEGQPVSVHPVAAITKGAKGEDFTDMIDLHHAGAVAFSDGDHPLQNADLLVKTLQYLKPFNGLLMNRPEEKMLTRFGQMHEGVQSTLLGLKGLPALAEELIVDRDLRLLDYALGKEPVSAPVLHFSTISSARSVELIRRAKAQGMPVSCDVAVHQLIFDDSALATFDTNLKVDPPFRSKTDVQALWYGLADGTIDAIVSDHNPQDDESKNLEFDLADFGIIGLETLFGALVSHNQGLSLGQIVHKLAVRPRQILRLLPVIVDQGQAATLTLFNPERPWTFTHTLSKSKNSPFLGNTLTGAVLGIINRGQFVQNAGI